MAIDEVEIKNVGGPNGAASEATLKMLLDATKNQVLGASAQARTAQRLQQNYNNAQNRGTGFINKTATAAKNLAREFASGGDRVSDFTRHVLGANSKLQGLIDYADGAVDQFRQLSSVGAGFNNSIFDMMTTAATAGMRLDEFYNVVQNNSEVLRMLGGTVTAGAKEFGNLSKGLRSGDLGRRLLNLGFTVSDINDGMLTYIQNQQLQGTLERMSQQDLIKGSQEYLSEIDLLAKATGISRQALLNQTADLNENAQFQSLMARAGAGGAADLEKNLAAVAGLMPGFTNDIIEMSSGFQGTDLAIALNSAGAAGQQFADLMGNAGNMDQSEFLKQLSILGPQIADTVSAMDPAAIGRLRASGSPLAALFDAMGSFQRMGNIDPEAAQKAQDAQDGLTNVLTGFSNAIALVKTDILDAFIESTFASKLAEIGDSLSTTWTNLFSTEGAATGIQTGFTSFKEKMFGPDGVLTNMASSFKTEIDNFNAAINGGTPPMDYLRERAGELGTQLKNWFTDMIFGSMDETGVRGSMGGGLLDTISTGFSSIMAAAKTKVLDFMGFDTASGETIMSQLMTKVFGQAESGQENMSVFSRIIDETVNGIKNAFASESFQTKMDSIIDTLKPMMESAIASLMSALNDTWLGYLIPNSATTTSAEKMAELVSRFDRVAEGYEDSSGYNRTGKAMGMSSLISEMRELNGGQLPEGLELPGGYTPPQRRVGTLRATGKTSEPKDTTARIHAGERVLNPSETAAVNDLPSAIKQLNTLTAQLVALTSQSLSYQEKTARGIRNLGSDMLT
jgi:hypothetical protein